MRKLYAGLAGVVLGLALHISAQTAMLGSFSNAAPPDSIVQVAADSQGLQQVALADLPRGGTFWYVTPGGIAAPFPCPPQDVNAIIYQITDTAFLVDQTGGQVTVATHRLGMQTTTTSTVDAALSAQADAVVNLITQIQTQDDNQQMRMMLRSFGMNDGAPSPGDGGSYGGTNYTDGSYFNYTFDTNQLWLEITNVANGWSGLNLHNATNQVYAIWGTTNLLGSWNVETELWPTPDQTNVLPFAIQNFDRQNLFLRAEDWTGVDSNGDGIPDWWIFKFFGDLSETATNLDAQGNSLLTDYQNFTNGITPCDPNVIQFTLTTSNLYLTSTTANMQLNLTAGVPNYYAVLLNDQTVTNWLPFTATNLNVYLGATDGVYVVSVGLRGLPADATETWASLAFTRDTTPPTLTITNLPSLSGSRPFIDPAGYAAKALSSIRYTVIDANGGTNSGNGIVTAQGLNLSDPNQVTSWIECVDLALALGTNRIFIQTVDWAGNVAVTNFNYVFDTNGDTTAPAVSLAWPAAGTLISGDSFTVQGTLDDDTATASLQYLDTNGILQAVNGLVERGGNLWVENVPLVPGTNNFTLTTTDAAGNMSSTNINVIQSDLALVINPLDSGAMNYALGTVTGTVDDPDALITVNGIQGTNYAGYWEVDNVPLGTNGTVTLLATAQPIEGAPTQTLLEEDRQPVVFTQSYEYGLDFSGLWVFGSVTETCHIELNWARGQGGTNLNVDEGVEIDTGYYTRSVTETIWPPDNGYIPTLAGQTIISVYDGDTLWYSLTNSVPAPRVEWMEQSSSAGAWVPSYYYPVYYVNWNESSGRAVKLFTGGKATRPQQTLFDLSAGLTQENNWFDPADPENWMVTTDGLLFETFLWTYLPTVAVPSAQIDLGGLGNLDEDGQLWKVLPDGKEIVITPAVAGGSAEGSSSAFRADASKPTSSADSALNVTGSLPTAPKYVPHITANGITLSNDVVATGANFCVGQDVPFALSGLPDGAIADYFQWTLNGTFVNDHNQANSYCSDNYFENEDLLKNAVLTNCWWVSGGFSPPAIYKASVTCTLYFTNGSLPVGINVSGLFTMHKPKPNIIQTFKYGTPTVLASYNMLTLYEFYQVGGGVRQTNSMQFVGGIESHGFSGYGKFVQIGNIDLTGYAYTNGVTVANPNVTGVLDNEDPYGSQPAISHDVIPSLVPNYNTVELVDAPEANGLLTVRLNCDFTDYLMFQPNTSGSIYVPLGTVDWHVHSHGSAPLFSILPDATVIGPGDITDTENFPAWTIILSNP